MFTKEDLRNAFFDGIIAGRKGCEYNLDEFNKWYATIHGARDKPTVPHPAEAPITVRGE